jgi:hypothetical protein
MAGELWPRLEPAKAGHLGPCGSHAPHHLIVIRSRSRAFLLADAFISLGSADKTGAWDTKLRLELGKQEYV